MSHFLASQSVGALDYEQGSKESVIVTMPAVGAATQADYVRIITIDSESQAIAIDIDADGTAPSGAYYVAATSKKSIPYVNAVFETYVVTIPATTGITQGDYFMIYSAVGVATAVWFDIDAAGVVPTGASYVSATNKKKASIVTGGSNTDNALVVHTLVHGLTGVNDVNNLDGTISYTMTVAGPCTNAVSTGADGTGDGGATIGTITKGVLATTAIVGGALFLAALTLANVSGVNNGNGTVTVSYEHIGNASNAVTMSAADGGAGSMTLSSTNGSAASFPYPAPSVNPATRTNTPSLVT